MNITKGERRELAKGVIFTGNYRAYEKKGRYGCTHEIVCPCGDTRFVTMFKIKGYQKTHGGMCKKCLNVGKPCFDSFLEKSDKIGFMGILTGAYDLEKRERPIKKGNINGVYIRWEYLCQSCLEPCWVRQGQVNSCTGYCRACASSRHIDTAEVKARLAKCKTYAAKFLKLNRRKTTGKESKTTATTLVFESQCICGVNVTSRVNFIARPNFTGLCSNCQFLPKKYGEMAATRREIIKIEKLLKERK